MTAPPTVADKVEPLMPAMPPDPETESASASLSPSAMTSSAPVLAMLPLDATEDSTRAPDVTSAVAPDPVNPTPPTAIVSVEASALLTPLALTVTWLDDSTLPSILALVPAATSASLRMIEPEIKPPAPPPALAVAVLRASASTFSRPVSVIWAPAPIQASVSALAVMCAPAFRPVPPAMPTAAAVGSDVAVLRDFDSTLSTPVLTVALAPIPAKVRPLTVAESSSAVMAMAPKARPVVEPSAKEMLSALIFTVPPVAVMLPPAPTKASVARLTSVEASTTVTPASPTAAPVTVALAVLTDVARMSTLVAVMLEPPVA